MSSNEWYTPARYVEAVREVFGGVIDLDPASCEYANRIVQARRIYTIHDNALEREWHARSIFCNPPYGRTKRGGSNLELFCKHLDEQYKKGHVAQAILLIPTNTATSWFPMLWDYPICFPDFRLRFYNEQGMSDGASFGTCFVYLGPYEQRFIAVFSQFGRIAKAIDSPKPREQQAYLFDVVCERR